MRDGREFIQHVKGKVVERVVIVTDPYRNDQALVTRSIPSHRSW